MSIILLDLNEEPQFLGYMPSEYKRKFSESKVSQLAGLQVAHAHTDVHATVV